MGEREEKASQRCMSASGILRGDPSEDRSVVDPELVVLDQRSMQMTRPAKDDEREERIHMEIIVDAYGPEEQALGW